MKKLNDHLENEVKILNQFDLISSAVDIAWKNDNKAAFITVKTQNHTFKINGRTIKLRKYEDTEKYELIMKTKNDESPILKVRREITYSLKKSEYKSILKTLLLIDNAIHYYAVKYRFCFKKYVVDNCYISVDSVNTSTETEPMITRNQILKYIEIEANDDKASLDDIKTFLLKMNIPTSGLKFSNDGINTLISKLNLENSLI